MSQIPPTNPDVIVFQLIGEEGFERLTRAFYGQVESDDLLGPMYPQKEFEAARLRLRDFLVYRFGGPARYIEQRGHPRLRVRHAPFPVDQAARDRWLTFMENALDEAALPPQATAILREFFHNTATFLINKSEQGSGEGSGPRFPLRE